ncbi:MAG: DUF3576 domain-containing protein [Ferrovibrio sp.]
MAALRPIRFRAPSITIPVMLAAAVLVLASCSSPNDGETQTYYPEKNQYGTYDPAPSSGRQSVFGQDGFNLFGGSRNKTDNQPGSGIGVNSYLWRASLDTVSFMPLTSADPFGGVIITDWYVPPQTPGERFKVTVYILDRTLRADGLRVGVFRQVRQGESWIDQPAAPNTATTMENAILQRAREFRMEAEARR